MDEVIATNLYHSLNGILEIIEHYECYELAFSEDTLSIIPDLNDVAEKVAKIKLKCLPYVIL